MKEIFQLKRVRYELGDFIRYLEETDDIFELGIASGVLYHLLNPVELIRLLSLRCRSILLWTVYYDEGFMADNVEVGRRFHETPAETVTGGFAHKLYRKRYDEALEWKGFCGGGDVEACWLERETILAAFQYFGFRVMEVVDEKNPNGSAMLLAATRQ
ncbi:hypothetical protein K0B96_05460 [Horticoccus luteus]|uniref:Methyltransferase family protein n=1 Tax=Horticoccus luteus TaxID=2862869 RepID=A0A8F9TY00_9BACT|nr:hypothetical protein [Horticoccus luteus]QYM80067.1 hypothetical protein K0B96_05460 [Horticoccus luteus]